MSKGNLFKVYPLWDIEPVRGKGCRVWDANDKLYVDFYGGHGVISIGHSHPYYVEKIKEQAEKMVFYSNFVLSSLQVELSEKLARQSGYDDYLLFLCNSGAEATENAVKLASFKTGKKHVLAFNQGFHGRTSGALAITDNPSIQSPFNTTHEVTLVPLNDIDAVERCLETDDYAAVIVEPIQGIAGIFCADIEFMQQLEVLCKRWKVPLIVDEVQSGYGRTGKFFAHQYANIKPDIICMAKGMGNGFPIGGILISPDFEATDGILGTTFGGTHLACAASIAVLDVMRMERLIENAADVGAYFIDRLKECKGIKEVRGKGLMIGIELEPKYAGLRDKLVYEHGVFTGVSKNNVLRLLPPLCVTKEEVDGFLGEFEEAIGEFN